MPSPVVEIKNLGLCFGETWIHQHLDLTIYAGETLAIVGGSGSGKTMLLKQMLTLQEATTGSIHILGVDVRHATETQMKQIRQSWGVVFQSGALFSDLTTLENIAFPLKQYTNLQDSLIESLAMLKLQLVGLSPNTAFKYPDELSGGMQKRVAMARACSMDPVLLFLDEPTAGLDPKSAHGFDELVLHLKRSLNLTVVMVTHDLDSLWHISDRVAFLGEGRVLGIAPIAELAQQEHPLIKDYFSGPRGRTTAKEYTSRE